MINAKLGSGLLEVWARNNAPSRYFGDVAKKILGRRFSKIDDVKVLIYYEGNDISYSQVYPFLRFSKEIKSRLNASIRMLPFDRFIAGVSPETGPADIVLIQPWFTVDTAELGTALARHQETYRHSSLSILDSFAHNDLRLAQVLDPHVKFYLKKSIFIDDRNYLRAYRGDTNLTEFYGALYKIDAAAVDWHVPPDFSARLRLSPNFLTAPRFERGLSGAGPSLSADRPIDIHTRLGTQGSPWYTAMRRHALDQVNSLRGVVRSASGRTPYTEYMREMHASKLCFSPFGYGELCWRDIEAIEAGSVLIKPDMGHLRTLPDLYEPGVTYLPVRWDFADLEEVVQRALADPDARRRIASEAFARASSYLATRQFVDDMKFLFQ